MVILFCLQSVCVCVQTFSFAVSSFHAGMNWHVICGLCCRLSSADNFGEYAFESQLMIWFSVRHV